MLRNRIALAVWAVFMDQAGDGTGGSSSGGGAGGDAAAAAAATAAAAAAAGTAGDQGTNANATQNAGAGGNGAGGSDANANGAAAAAGDAKPVVYDLKLPEATTLTQADVDKVTAFAKEKGLSNEQAQDVLAQRHEAAADVTKANEAKLTEVKTAWHNELKADTEFGGVNLDKNGELAAKAITAFGGEALLKSVKEAGFNMHPGFFRMMTRIGKAMAEDKPLDNPASGGSGAAKSAESVLYGSKS